MGSVLSRDRSPSRIFAALEIVPLAVGMDRARGQFETVRGDLQVRLRFKATHVVLAMLCVMYFITYIDRVNIGTAASEIQ